MGNASVTDKRTDGEGAWNLPLGAFFCYVFGEVTPPPPARARPCPLAPEAATPPPSEAKWIVTPPQA